MGTTMKPNSAKYLLGLAALLAGNWAGAGDVSYTYDDLDRLTSVTYGDGSKTSYTYDEPGNIGSVITTAAKSTQTIGAIGFSTIALAVGETATASATATSGLAVSFSSATPDVCSVSGNAITLLAAGVCTVAADQSGSAAYYPAPQVRQDVPTLRPGGTAIGGTTYYLDYADGTVTDLRTGLTWMRCAQGQTWSGSTCDGESTAYTGVQAAALTGTVSYATFSDWRAPNIRELQSIVDRSVSGSPAINASVFPNTPSSRFWSATPKASDYGVTQAWAVNFGNGYIAFTSRTSTTSLYPVRLVRGGQPSALLNPARPNVDYLDNGDGTVTHAPTGLMWQRCAEGQSWSGSSCTGTASTLAFSAAKTLTSSFAGRTDWRLPTVEELLSLMDYTVTTSTLMNQTMFPNAPTSYTWSSTPYGTSGSVWGVDFGWGYGDVPASYNNYAVRFVRGAGGSTTSSTTTTTTTTTTASTTTTTQVGGGAPTLNAVTGWNLLGNSSSGNLDVASAFSDTAKVTTVWKWIASGAKWAFYAPSLLGQALTDYATGKGYDVLTTINGGEGFWVNAKTGFTVSLPAGTAISSASFQSMGSGWNLIAVGDSPTPSAFNKAIGQTQPAAGEIPVNLTTLWAWDAAAANWYFYAPTLDKSGGLASYIISKSYLDFGTRVLDPVTGFWVNKP